MGFLFVNAGDGFAFAVAEYSMHLDYFFLPFEGFEVVGDCDQVLFGSQLIGWMPPITVGEDS